MTTLRQAAEQALDALMYCEPCCEENPKGFQRWADAMPALREALAQPEWVGLTDAEIWQMVNDCTFAHDLHADKFARAIEAKLRSKNQ